MPQLENICTFTLTSEGKETIKISLIYQQHRYIQTFLDDMHCSLSQFLNQEKVQFDLITNSSSDKKFTHKEDRKRYL